MQTIFERIQAMIAPAPERWHNLVQSTPADLLARQPAPGEWSAIECLEHVIDTEKIFHSRIQWFLEGKDFPAFDPDSEGSKPGEHTPAEMAADFEALRRQSLKIIGGLSEADLDRRVRHSKLGPVTLREMLNEWPAHDLNHIMQAERALMQPFLHECGPWVEYFTEHLVKEK